MSRRTMIDKTGRDPVSAQQAANWGPDEVLRRGLGFYPLGLYKGAVRFLTLDNLVEPLVLAEKAYSLDRVDDRDKVEAKIVSGSAIAARATAKLTVASGEILALNRVVLVSPSESGAGVGDIVKVNFRIKSWAFPDERTGTTVNENGRSYWKDAKGTASTDTYTVDLPAQGELGEELLLLPGDVLTLDAELTGATAGADLTASLTPYGRKVKKLALVHD